MGLTANILLTCAGRRHYLAQYFHEELKGRGKVVGTDMDLTAPALVACDEVVQVPAVSAPNYLDSLLDAIKQHEINLIFSLNDLEVGLLSANRDFIYKETGALVYVPPQETLRVCLDKWATFQFASAHGISAPQSWLSVSDALHSIEQAEASFPLMVKPRWGSASIGLFKVDDADSLENAFTICTEAINSSALANLGQQDAVIIQEFIEGPEYGVDVLFNKSQELIGFTAKRKLAMRAGETDKSVTVDRAPFEQSVSVIARQLPHRGNMDCDFIERDGELYLLELNPRFGGGYPFTHLAGANHVRMLIDDYLGQPIGIYSYKTNLAFAKCDFLVEVPF